MTQEKEKRPTLTGRQPALTVVETLRSGGSVDANTWLQAVGKAEDLRIDQFRKPKRSRPIFEHNGASPILGLQPDECTVLSLIATGHEKSEIPRLLKTNLGTIVSIIATIQGRASKIQRAKIPTEQKKLKSINYALQVAIEEGSLNIPVPETLQLTKSEFSILQLLAEGNIIGNICKTLSISNTDANNTIKILEIKLNAKNRRHLTAMSMMIMAHGNLPQTK